MINFSHNNRGIDRQELLGCKYHPSALGKQKIIKSKRISLFFLQIYIRNQYLKGLGLSNANFLHLIKYQKVISIIFKKNSVFFSKI